MHIILTDILTCPRCGPEFGLILLADEMRDRFAVSGRLGCANCREEYAIREGVAELRLSPGETAAAGGPPERPEGWTYRLAALLGLAESPGPVLVVGGDAESLAELGSVAPHARVVGASQRTEAAAYDEAVDRVLHGATLPFRSRSLRGVALVGGTSPALLDEAIRTLAPDSRIVVDPATPEAVRHLRSGGLNLLLDEDGVAVAATPGRG